MKKPSKTKELLDKYTTAEEYMPISCLPQGFYDGGITMDPCIFIGPRHYMLLLYYDDVTLNILEKIFQKAIKDNNAAAVVDLLTYAIYNKKRFWQRYKKTELGTLVMAKILGQHD